MSIEKNIYPKNSSAPIFQDARSEEVQEIIGKMPTWIIRRGITLMGIIILGLLIGAYFFKYPDIIQAHVIITSANPPVKLIAQNSLAIQQLQVRNNEDVRKNQLICIFSNPADYQDVQQIAGITKILDTCMELRGFMEETDIPQGLNLGELQSNYVTLLKAVEDYRFFLLRNDYNAKINHLETLADYQKRLTAQLTQKDKKMNTQLAIQQNRFSVDSTLLALAIISKVEYENAMKDLVGQQMNAEDNYSAILQSQLQHDEITANVSETKIQWQTDKNNMEQKIREAARQFNGAFGEWEQNYVLRSPVSGKVSFFKYWKENQFVQAGQAILMITPPLQEFIARGEIGVHGAGKIKEGQKVLIKLFAYPYAEFGSITGKIASKSTVAMDSTFAIAIQLTNKLQTNAGVSIPPQAQLEGTAEILTDNKSLLARLFENVYGKRRG